MRLRHLFEYAALRLLVFPAMFIPWKVIGPLSEYLGPLMPRLMPRRRELVLSNIRSAFPEWSQEKSEAVSREFWLQITRMVLECLRALHNGKAWIRSNVILDNPEVLDEALKEGKGVLLHSGHFSNWEFIGARIASAGYPVAVIGRTQKNLWADGFLTRFRQGMGMTVFNHHQAVRETQRWLRKNGCLGILGDHNLYKGGIFIRFFNRPASSTTLAALLHAKLGSPVVGTYSYREGERQHVRFERIEFTGIDMEEADQSARVAAMTQHLAQRLESWVRHDPKSWLWGHNRWKRRPVPGEAVWDR